MDGLATAAGSVEESQVGDREIVPAGAADAYPGDCGWRSAVVGHSDGPGDARVDRDGGKGQSRRLKGHNSRGAAVRRALRVAEHRCGRDRGRQHDSGCGADNCCSAKEPARPSGRLLFLLGLLLVLSVPFARARHRTLRPQLARLLVARLGITLESEQPGGSAHPVVKARACRLLGC